MRICPKCKAKNKEGAKYCADCGHEFGVIIRPSPKNGGGQRGTKDPYYVGTTIDGTEISHDPHRN